MTRLFNVSENLPAQVHPDKPVGMRKAFDLFSVLPDFQITLMKRTGHQKFVINQLLSNPEKTRIGMLIEIVQPSVIPFLKQGKVVAILFGFDGQVAE